MAKAGTHLNGQNGVPLKWPKHGPTCLANYDATPNTPTTQPTAPHSAKRRPRAVPKMHFSGAFFFAISTLLTHTAPHNDFQRRLPQSCLRRLSTIVRLWHDARASRAHRYQRFRRRWRGARSARCARALRYVPMRHGARPRDTALAPNAADGPSRGLSEIFKNAKFRISTPASTWFKIICGGQDPAGWTQTDAERLFRTSFAKNCSVGP